MSTDHPLIRAFHIQAQACAVLGSPFMDRLCTHLAETLAPGTPLTDRLFNWPGDPMPSADSVPLRLCGALHALKLQNKAGLAAIYPPNSPDNATFAKGIAHALETEAAFIDRFLNSPPQTNEVRRSSALIAAAHWLSEQHDLPLKLSELGASAGLNLMFDHFALDINGTTFGAETPALRLSPDWTGPPPPNTKPIVAERRAVDLNPLDPHVTGDKLRLRAYLWPDQPHRRALTDAAMNVAQNAPDKGDAVDWLAPRLAHTQGQTHLIYSTVAWQYFPAAKQAQGQAMIEQAGAAATDQSPLAWLQMEADGNSPGAGLTLRLWPGNRHIQLGRCDFHGRWMHWQPTESALGSQQNTETPP